MGSRSGGGKAAFEDFVDLIITRLDAHPEMHVYHYAGYEPHALKRLMGRHGTREAEVDRLLRGEVLVDLYRVVKVQALTAKASHNATGGIRDGRVGPIGEVRG